MSLVSISTAWLQISQYIFSSDLLCYSFMFHFVLQACIQTAYESEYVCLIHPSH